MHARCRNDSEAKGANRSKRVLTNMGEQNSPRNAELPRHFLGASGGYISHNDINDCLFQSDVAYIYSLKSKLLQFKRGIFSPLPPK